MKQRIAASILAMVMVASQAAPAMAANEMDSHWASAAMNTWQGYGVLQGDENGNLNPDKPITRAELAVMLDRVMEYQVQAKNTFTDLDNSWYTEAILGANAAGVLQGYNDGTVQPKKNITRQEAAVLFARVLDLDTADAPAAAYSDAAAIASWALPAVNAMSAEGYLQGSNGQFRPNDTITRAEVVTILNNIFASYISESGTYTEDVDGTAVISADGVNLKNMTVSGDLIIAEGVGAGHVELDSVTVEGRLIVRGGGENSIVIKGSSKIGTVSVARQDGKVRVAVEGNAKVSMVQIEDGADSVKIEGKVDAVTVAGSGAAVEIAGTVGTVTVDESAADAALTVSGTVTNVNVSGDNVTVNTTAAAKINKVTTSAANTTVSGDGKVTSVEAAAGSTGATVTTEGTKVENNGSGDVSLGGGETVKPGDSTGGSTGGSTSGGSSSGGSTVVTTANVATAEELTAALANSNITTIRISDTIGSADAYGTYTVDRAVTIQGGSVYGSFIVKADGAVFDGVTITNAASSEGADKNGINAACKVLTVKDCTFNMGTGATLGNGLSIWPTDSTVNYTITGNQFNGYEKSSGGYSSSAISISGGVVKTHVIADHTASVAAAMTDEQDLAIITGNTFTNCKVDYVRDCWTNGAAPQTVYAWAISYGNNLNAIGNAYNSNADYHAADGADYYINGDVTRDNVTVAEGVTLHILEGKTLTVNNSLENNGTITGEGTVAVATADAFKEAVASFPAVKLTADITLPAATWALDGSSINAVVDLNGHTLNFSNTTSTAMTLSNGASVTFRNGAIAANGYATNASTKSVIAITSGSSITLDGVEYDTTGSALFPRGDAATVNVINDSTITASGYCIATNASGAENFNVIVTVEDSTLDSNEVDGVTAGTAICFNVPGNLNVARSTIQGDWLGVLLRGGTATISDSTITHTGVTSSSNVNYKHNANWGEGNDVPPAALTIGNRSSGYQYATNLTMTNTTVTGLEGFPAIYAYANSDDSLGVTIEMDGCTINGDQFYASENIDLTNNLTGTAASQSGDVFTTIGDEFVLDLDNEIPAEVENNVFTQEQVSALGGSDAYKSLTLYVKVDSVLPQFDKITQKYVTADGELATMKSKSNTKDWTFDASAGTLNSEAGRYAVQDGNTYLKLALYSFHKDDAEAGWVLISDDAAKQVLEFYNGETLVATLTVDSPLSGYSVDPAVIEIS